MAVQSVKVTINGQEYTLTYDSSSGAYKTTITAPSKSSYTINDGHYYPVTVKATDDANNTTTVDDTHETLGDSCKLKVKEKVKPVIVATYPTASSAISNSTPTITWTVTDDDSGVDPDTISIKFNSDTTVTTGITKEPTTNGYNCSYTPTIPLGDGQHTIYLNASDFDGNAATEVSTAFTVDTVPPVLTVTSPSDNFTTNQSTVMVTGTTNDPTSNTVSLTVNGEPVEIGPDGAFNYEFTLSEGENTITIVATDAAGKSSTVVRHVTLDTGSPVITEITITPNPVDAGATYIISVKVTDD